MAGIHSKLSKCTPILKPVRYAMRISQRSLRGSSATFSHFRMSQNTTAVKRLEKAYTSPSTALYQKVSLQV